jgi:ParB family chromosome partitioning protein
MPEQFAVPSLLSGLIEDVALFEIQQPKKLLRQPNNIEELAASIRKKGLLQPIVIRTIPSQDDDDSEQKIRFEIVAGNRRYFACKLLGRKKITCHIVELDDREAFEIALIENVQRNTLTPIEEAQAFKAYVTDYGWGGVSDLSVKIAKSTSYITKRIKLLNLPAEVLQAIMNSSISVSVAEELYAVKDAIRQSELSALISRRHLSLRKVREMVNEGLGNDYEVDIFLPTRKINDDPLSDAQKAFDKSMIALRIAMNRLAAILEECEENTILYEMLMHHKQILHEQIDLMIREKRKAGNRLLI